MEYRKETEAQIDLQDAVFYLLAHWRGTLVMMLAAAVLLAGVTLAGQLNRDPDGGVAYLKKELEHNQSLMDSYQTAIDENNRQLEENEQWLALVEENLQQLLQTREDLQAQLESYQADVSLSEEQRLERVAQINGQLSDVEDRLLQEKQLQSSLMKEKAELPVSNADLATKVRNLQTTNSGLQTQIRGLSAGVVPSELVRNGILGAVLGLLLALVVYTVKYLTSDKLHSARQWNLEWKIPVLGNWSQPLKKGCGVDRWLYRMANRQKLPREQEQALAAAGLRVMDLKGKVYVLSSEDLSAAEQVQQSLTEKLGACDFTLQALESPLQRPENLLQMQNSQLLLAERVGKSSRKQVEAMLEMAARADVQILGTVLL